MRFNSAVLLLTSLSCMLALVVFSLNGWPVVAFSLFAGLSLSLVWLVVDRKHRRERERQQHRQQELEAMLALQEQKVERLTAFAEQMQESEIGTRAIIENALDGIITINHLGRIVELNPAAEKLFGYQRKEVLGQPLNEWIVPPSLREQQRRGMAHFLATGEGPMIGQRVETIGLRADGREIPVEIAVTVLHPVRPPLLTAYVRDLSQIKQTSAMLAQSNGRLQAILDAATQVAIIATNPKGVITLFNTGAERMLGYKAEELIGVHTLELIHVAEEVAAHARQLTDEFGAAIEGFEALVERARRGDHEEREWTYLRKEGSQLTVNLAVTAIRDSKGAIDGYLAVATDVTERHRAALALQRAKEAAEAANRAKSDFLANMSHEIRTPMNGILGMTALALDTNLTGEQREYLQLVKASADGLLTVINDILDFSKIEAGKLDMDPVEFQLRDTVADILRSLGFRANAKNLELACDIPADVPDFVIGDDTRLRQVLLNLVGNAIKFTERGEVLVVVELVTGTECEGGREMRAPMPFQPGSDIALHFAVSDTGIGIPADKLPYIFDAFVQADSSTTRKHGGTGLGLTITGRLVEMMGGRLWAESVPGEGSTFHFTINLKLQDRSSSRLLPWWPLDLKDLTVLVVDDNATHRRILEELLTSWLMNPTVVDGARSALAEMEAAAAVGEPFPLVLMDTHMPEQDGFALAAEIRGRPHLADAVLLMLSSANQHDDSEKCRTLDIGQRLIKPIKPSDLLDAILRSLDAKPCVSPSRSALSLLTLAPSSGDAIEVGSANTGWEPAVMSGLHVLVAEDNFVNQRLALAILEKQGHRVVVVGNGAAAVRAVQQDRFNLVLMDVQMPEMNGLEATRAIRAWERERGGRLPIVAMTAHAMKGAREDCFEAGMDSYLSKPIQVPELLRVIEELIRAKAKTAGAVVPLSRPVVFDPRPLRQRIGDDEELFHELIEMFQEDGPRILEQVRFAVELGNVDAIQRTTHLLKGSVSNFAATEVVQAAQRLENMARNGDLRDMASAYGVLEQSLSGFLKALNEWLNVHPV